MRALFMNSARVTEGAIALTGSILVCFAASLATQSVNTILTRAFYACNETRVPMATGISAIALNIALSVLFYSFTPMGVRGMAVAYTLSSLVNTAMLVALLNRRLPWLRLHESMAAFILKCGAASAAMAVALAAANRYIVPASWVAGEFSLGLKARQAAVLLANAGVGAALYFAAAVALGVPEAAQFFGTVGKFFQTCIDKLTKRGV
jgi:putative peptidoglycan lipid II flippase